MLSKQHHGQLTWGAVALVMLIAAPALTAQPVAVERLGASRLTIEPLTFFDSAVLRVSGPPGYELRKSFEAGASITADLFADRAVRDSNDTNGAEHPRETVSEGRDLPDGRYRYEVVFHPNREVFTGLFFVEGGLPASRGAVRQQLSEVREGLLRAGAEDVEAWGWTPPQGIENDNVQILDTVNDGITFLYLQSFNNPPNDPDWFMANYHGDLTFDLSPGPISMVIDAGGDVGIGTSAPLAPLHVTRVDGTAQILVEEASGTTTGRTLFELQNNGDTRFFFENTNSGDVFQMSLLGTVFQIASPSTGLGKFRVRKNGGLQALTGSTSIMDLDAAGNLTVTSVTQTSSREVKRNLAAVDGRQVLDKVVELPITEWSYKKENPDIRHLGPMAEDFHALFGLGKDEKGITSIDSSGVALAAIQGLNRKLEEKVDGRDARIAELSEQNAELEARVRQLEQVVQSLTARSESFVPEGPSAP